MMSNCVRSFAGAALIVAGCGAADAAVQAARGEITVRLQGPERPRDIVHIHAATCDRDRYQAELHGSGRSGSGATLVIRVNGREVAGRELGKIGAHIPEGLFLYNAVVTECPLNGRQARLRLMIGGPSTPTPLWLTFLVSHEGEVRDVRSE